MPVLKNIVKEAISYKSWRTVKIINTYIDKRFAISYSSCNICGNNILEGLRIPIFAQICAWFSCIFQINGLVQDCNNSIANALELLQSCPKTSEK